MRGISVEYVRFQTGRLFMRNRRRDSYAIPGIVCFGKFQMLNAKVKVYDLSSFLLLLWAPGKLATVRGLSEDGAVEPDFLMGKFETPGRVVKINPLYRGLCEDHSPN